MYNIYYTRGENSYVFIMFDVRIAYNCDIYQNNETQEVKAHLHLRLNGLNYEMVLLWNTIAPVSNIGQQSINQ